MNCPTCQSENPAQAKFCMQCGSPLAHRCQHCRTELPPQARFCPHCGQPVTAVTPPVPPSPAPVTGERRLVTVMFSDISGFTAMSEKMDPEQVRSLMNACFDRLVPIVQKFGGVVDKFIGDEIMALYGAPVAHEDDPARALYTALEMEQVLAQFNAENGTDLGMHAGVNTGLVVAGEIGSQGRRDYSVMGDAVNVAARLEDASERGEIYVGPDTHRLVAPLFEFEALPPIRVKGKAEPIQIYKLLHAKTQPGRLRGLVGLQSPMVGRETELTALMQLSDGLLAGQGGTAVLVGEPGLGKSRLLAEWQAQSVGSSQWGLGQCLSYGQGLAYHLLVDLLRSLCGISSAAEEAETRAALWQLMESLFAAEADEVHPYLCHLFSLPLAEEAAARIRRLDPQALQNHYLTAVRRLFLALAARQPLILVLEDIHWADPSSTELLIKLLPLIEEAPLLYCFLSRPDLDVPGWRLVTAVQEQYADRLTELTLRTLTDDDSRQLIANLLEIEALPDDIRGLILQKAEGNPFFVEEVIRMLIDRGAIVEGNNGWVAGETITEVDIPDNLQSLLLARIDRLPEDVKHTLRVASVIGRQFSVRVLEDVLKQMA